MTYLITQIFISLLLAALIGLLLGWYLTRLAAAAGSDALQQRLRKAEHATRELQAELKAVTASRDGLSAESQALRREIAALKAELEDARPQPATGTAASGTAATVQAVGRIADDLRQIRGIGPKIATLLSGLGVDRIDQVAAWTDDDVARFDQQLRFRGRIDREQWVAQARELLAARDA